MGLMNRKQISAELLQIRTLLREQKLLPASRNEALILASEIVTIRRLPAQKPGTVMVPARANAK